MSSPPRDPSSRGGSSDSPVRTPPSIGSATTTSLPAATTDTADTIVTNETAEEGNNARPPPIPMMIPGPGGHMHPIFPMGMGFGPGGIMFGPPPPGFHPPFANSAGQPLNTPSSTGQPDLDAHPAPGSNTTPGFTFFMSIFNGPPPSEQPDPQAAEELIRSLPPISKGLFDRVNMVVSAEQKMDGDVDEEPGWKCAICLEGLNEETIQNDNDIGIKGLPCNHLFHSGCLRPWFESHHTCPTCRLDLDPLHTLRGSTRTGGGRSRPGPGGAGPRTHPYGGRPPSENVEGPDDTAPIPQFTFVWHMPVPVPTLTLTGEAPGPDGASPPEGSQANPSTPTTAEGPRTPAQHFPPIPSVFLSPPTQTFDIPLRSSPAPMTRNASDGAESSSSAAGPSSPSFTSQMPGSFPGGGRPLPQRRVHINMETVHRHNPVQVIPAAADPSNGNLHGSEAEAPRAPIIAPFLPPVPTLSPFPASHVRPPHPIPHFQTVINIGNPQPPARFHTTAATPPNTQEPSGEPSPTLPQTKAVIRETLDAWVETREKALGWRCDAPICFKAPTSDHPEVEGDPEQTISILSPLQVAESSGQDFELHSCEHRWHRSCLETTVKTSGRWNPGNDQHKVWVRCDRCRKDGWIPRTNPDATSETLA